MSLALALCLALGAGCRAAAPTRARLQAAYLYRFLEYAQWPDTSGEFSICSWGNESVAQELEASVTGRSMLNHPVTTRRVTRVAQVQGCQILFITGSLKNIAQALRELAGQPVLTVGDVDQFAELGGVIQFVSSGDQLGLSISVENARRQGIRLSSRLVQLSRKKD